MKMGAYTTVKDILPIVGCGILFYLSVASRSRPFEREPMGTITFPLGDVYIQREGEADWNDVYLHMPAYERDKIKTSEESRCEITLMDRKIVRIGEKTIFELTREPDGGEIVSIESGKAWINALFSKKKRFQVHTPTAVAAIRGTVYRLSCDSIYSSYRVYRGSIAVTPLKEDEELEDSTFYVNAGEEFIVVKDFEEYKRRQKEAFKKFKERELYKFEEFKRRQREKFEEFKQREEEAFRQFKAFHYVLTKFDVEEDRKSDWVRWNLERDRQLGR